MFQKEFGGFLTRSASCIYRHHEQRKSNRATAAATVVARKMMSKVVGRVSEPFDLEKRAALHIRRDAFMLIFHRR